MRDTVKRYYVHEVPGRVRIRIPSLKRDLKKASRLKDLLMTLAGVGLVSVKTLTGSVVVQFDPQIINSYTILMLLMQEGYIDFKAAISQENHVETALSGVGEAASKALLGLVLDRALQGTPFAILTAFI